MLKKSEIEATAKIIDSLSPHQVLKLKVDAKASEIKLAFDREKEIFNPALYQDQATQNLVQKIRDKIDEAYAAIGNQSFEALDPAAEDNFDPDMITSAQDRPNWTGNGPGEKFHELALKAFAAKDFQSAFVNIQIALSAEAENPRFLVLKERIEIELKKAKKLKK